MHDLNFWMEPDWKRESTLNPNFLMTVIIALFVVAGVGLATFANRAKAAAEDTLNQVNAQLQSVQHTASTLKQMQSEIVLWQGHLETLKGDTGETIFWSRQLEEIQALTPPEIQLNNLEIRGESVREKLPANTAAGRPQPVIVTRTVYHLRIRGEARVEVGATSNPQAIITQFADTIAANPVIGDRLKHYEIQNITELRSNENDTGPVGRSFVFSCSYKEME